MVTPFLSTVVLGGGAILEGGSDAQKEKILPGVCSGDTVLALALQEGARHDPAAIATTATAVDGGYRISGEKVFVLDGAQADHWVVAARTSGTSGDRDGITLFLVDASTDGVEVGGSILIDSRSAATLTFRDVQVEAAAVVGEVDRGSDVLDPVLDRAAACVSAEMLGGIDESFAMTVQYLKDREQFGVKIGTFQGLKHRAARWFCEVELTRSIVLKALRALDEGDADAPAIVSACKARASDTFHLSGNEGIQMHGGVGVTDEEDIGFYMKRARVSELLFGDGAYHRNRFASLRSY